MRSERQPYNSGEKEKDLNMKSRERVVKRGQEYNENEKYKKNESESETEA
jgi:hypothetical protein